MIIERKKKLFPSIKRFADLNPKAKIIFNFIKSIWDTYICDVPEKDVFTFCSRDPSMEDFLRKDGIRDFPEDQTYVNLKNGIAVHLRKEVFSDGEVAIIPSLEEFPIEKTSELLKNKSLYYRYITIDDESADKYKINYADGSSYPERYKSYLIQGAASRRFSNDDTERKSVYIRYDVIGVRVSRLNQEHTYWLRSSNSDFSAVFNLLLQIKSLIIDDEGRVPMNDSEIVNAIYLNKYTVP